MTSTILVTGGTGRLGNHLVPMLRGAGETVRVLSRNAKEAKDGVTYFAADLIEGKGIDPAVKGVDTIIHLAGGPKGDDKATENLVRAAQRAGVKHIIYISVIGCDKVPLGYFAAKHDSEKIIAKSGIPWTTVRAAQFHDLVWDDVVTKMEKLPVIPIPGGVRFQPVDTREVASRLFELSQGEPKGMVPDLAGPKLYGMKDLVTSYLQAKGKKRIYLPVRFPGKAGKAYREGVNLTLKGADQGTVTWESFLAERVNAA